MNIREAILKAADHIVQHPQEFAFRSIVIPRERHCGTPGCALGWIGCFLGAAKGGKTPLSEILVSPLLGFGHWQPSPFYDRMEALVIDWRYSADECARALRLYADKYHPAEKPKQGMPASVRAIFETTQPESVLSE